MKIIKYLNKEDANNKLNEINSIIGYPNETTLTYSNILNIYLNIPEEFKTHEIFAFYALPIDDTIYELLTEFEYENIIELDMQLYKIIN